MRTHYSYRIANTQHCAEKVLPWQRIFQMITCYIFTVDAIVERPVPFWLCLEKHKRGPAQMDIQHLKSNREVFKLLKTKGETTRLYGAMPYNCKNGQIIEMHLGLLHYILNFLRCCNIKPTLVARQSTWISCILIYHLIHPNKVGVTVIGYTCLTQWCLHLLC